MFISNITYLDLISYSPSEVPIFLAIKLFKFGFIVQFVNFSSITGFASVSLKSRTTTSNVELLNDMFTQDNLTCLFASLPSEININLNNS